MAKPPKHGLGRGLEALLGGEQLKAPDPGDQVLSIRLQDIDVNREQPRRTFDEEGLRELSESIRSVGVVQPILVARTGARYSIIAGERRFRAARLAGAEAAIRLTKNLPVSSGIGGGSADAAAVLRGLARMGHPLPAHPEALGADVPVCLASETVRMQGIGEVLSPVPPLPRFWIVLANPGVALSTPQIFAGLERRDNPALPPLARLPDLAALTGWLALTRNDLQPPAIACAPVIASVLDALRAEGAAFARMSGSGATCFGLFPGAGQAQAAAASLARHGWWSVATELASPAAQG